MPFNHDAMYRRRHVLQISQHNLAIMAGIHPATVSKIERGGLPNEGGQLGIDVMMRLAEALKMDWSELLIPPTGNRYQQAVQFAKNSLPPGQAPQYHDMRRTVQAEGLRKITRDVTPQDTQEVVDREEPDTVVTVSEDTPYFKEEDILKGADETGEHPGVAAALEQIRFQRDPSTE